MKRWVIAAFAISLAGVLAGCGTAATEPAAPSAARPSATVAPREALQTPAPDFTVRVARANGNQLVFSDLRLSEQKGRDRKSVV